MLAASRFAGCRSRTLCVLVIYCTAADWGIARHPASRDGVQERFAFLSVAVGQGAFVSYAVIVRSLLCPRSCAIYPYMIEVENITKRYGGVEAVRDLSFSVGTEQVLGFLGPNGAGKTTVMKILTGYHFPSSGRAEVEGF